MESIKNIIEQGSYPGPKKHRLFTAKCTGKQFKELFLEAANKRIPHPFDVDSFNQNVINQLYYYLIGSPLFNGSLTKGILLIGPKGTGKSILMKSFLDVFPKVTNFNVELIDSISIADKIRNQNLEYYYKRPIYIDDIGKEQIEAIIYGNVSRPFEHLFSFRYNNEALTFGSSNLIIEHMQYEMHSKDRMIERFNILELLGKSRRK